MARCPDGWYDDKLIEGQCCPCSRCSDTDHLHQVHPQCKDLADAGKRSFKNICLSMQSDCQLLPVSTINKSTTTQIIHPDDRHVTSHHQQSTADQVLAAEVTISPKNNTIVTMNGSTMVMTGDARTRMLLIIAILIIGILMILGICVLLVYKRKKMRRRSAADLHICEASSSTQLKRRSLVCEVVSMEESSLIQQTTNNCDLVHSKVSEALKTTATETTYLKSASQEEKTSTAKFETFDDGSIRQQQEIINEDESSIVAFHVPQATKPQPSAETDKSDDPGRTFVSDSATSMGGSDDLVKNKNNQSNNTTTSGGSKSPPTFQVNYKSKDQAVEASFPPSSEQPTCKLEMNGDYNSFYICGTREGFLIQATNPQQQPSCSQSTTLPLVEDLHKRFNKPTCEDLLLNKKFKMESATAEAAESAEDQVENNDKDDEKLKEEETEQETEVEEEATEEEEEENLRSTIPLLVTSDEISSISRRSKFAGLSRHHDDVIVGSLDDIQRDDDVIDKELLSNGVAISCEDWKGKNGRSDGKNSQNSPPSSSFR